MIDAVLKHLADDAPNALARLSQLLAIPSVSTDPAYKSGIDEATRCVADTLRALALDVTVHPTEGHPIIVARSETSGGTAGGNSGGNSGGTCGGASARPRVLFYGHYDVQPPDPIDKWTTPPFEPTIRDGAIYARGASDDKGQVCCFLEALRAWHTVHGRLPVDVTVLLEGEEECGSVHLPAFLHEHRDLLAADVAIISDTTMWDDTTVAITYGLRGLLYFDIQLHGPSRDLHSGVYGGTLANPATTLTRVLGRLFDENNRVTIPGFYDDVAPITDDERRRWAALHFDDHAFLGAVGVSEPFGEAGFDTLERRWARPACDVNGLYGGYGGAGAKTVIPSFAGAKVSFRIPPDMDPAKIADSFRAWLQSHDTGGCRWRITQHGSAWPVIVADDSPYMTAARRAVEQSSGKPPVLVREGATIPVVADFKTVLGIDSLLIGFGRTDDCIHSPNEKFNLANFKLGCRTHAAVLAQMGAEA